MLHHYYDCPLSDFQRLMYVCGNKGESVKLEPVINSTRLQRENYRRAISLVHLGTLSAKGVVLRKVD